MNYTSENITCGLNYKPMTIVNDDSRVVTKLETSLTDDARVILYDRHMFKVQATDQHKYIYVDIVSLLALGHFMSIRMVL